MTDLIHNHGVVLDKKKSRVSCKYCYKVVSGFNRLKCHLGGVRGDVVPCQKVPADVKAVMRDRMIERNKQKLTREVDQLQYPNLSLQRNLGFQSSEVKSSQHEFTEPTIQGREGEVLESTNKDTAGRKSIPCKRVDAHEPDTCRLADPSRNLLRCIGRFFYDAGINFEASRSPFFKRMLDAFIGCGTECKLPSYHELRGWILQEEVKEMQEHVGMVKHSWEGTGCSILLDGWTNENGRCLINFLVGCPQGVIFLRSVDASDYIGGIDALCSLVNDVIEEVGVKNVVQVITYNASHVMEAAGKKLMEKHNTIFWNICAVHCVNLILEKIGMMSDVMGVLNKAKTITRFIYSHGSILKLMRNHTRGRDLVIHSKMRSVTSFLTLENIVSEKGNLMNMFSSSAWNSSFWVSKIEGKKIAELVHEPSFWMGAKEALKVSDPLICVLRLIDGGHKPLLGYIYETMDQAKEAIKRNFGGKKARYMPFWDVIDKIWDNHLHSPLHAAGYFLNPSIFYSSDFFSDAEVTNGLLCCIIRMVEDKHKQDLIVSQLEMYRAAMGSFAQKRAIDERKNTPPALWWALYGDSCPELQKLAIRILSQTCSGASSYHLKRSLFEQLHTKGRNVIEQKRLSDLVFVHYNLRLQHSLSIADVNKDNIDQEDMDPMDDWDVEEPTLGDDDLDWMDTDNNCTNRIENITNVGSSGIQVKKELQSV